MTTKPHGLNTGRLFSHFFANMFELGYNTLIMTNAENLPSEPDRSSIEDFLHKKNIREEASKKVLQETIKGHTIGLFADYPKIIGLIVAGEQSALILGGTVTSTAEYPGNSLDIALISSLGDGFKTTTVILGEASYKISPEGRVTSPEIDDMEMTLSGLSTLSSLLGQRAPEADYNKMRTDAAIEAWRQSHQTPQSK
jgi:hypothetical protein